MDRIYCYQMQRIKWKRTPLALLLVTLTSLFIMCFENTRLQKPVSIRPYQVTANCVKAFNRADIKYKLHKKIWQNLTTPYHQRIYLYGAYYDDRPMHNGKIFIQILAVGSFASQTANAVIWSEKSIWNAARTTCSATKHGRGHRIDGLYYNQFFFSCEIKKMTAKPKFVSLTFNKCLLQSNLLAIHIPERTRKHKFSVCVETAYGHISPKQIIEWVEANRLMGVTMFSVYPCNMSKNNLEIFRQLESEGLMRVSMTPSPLPETTWANQMLSSPASFNDCMMRQIYSAEYIIPLDFDEIISPRKNAINYETLIKEVDRVHKSKKPFPVYSFRMGLYFTTCGTNSSGELNINRYIKRTRFYGNVKSIVNPRMCLSVFNHYCKVNFKSLKFPSRINVEAEIGLVNHYRKSWSKRYCNFLHKDGVIDVVFRNKFSAFILKQYKKRVARYRKLKLL